MTGAGTVRAPSRDPLTLSAVRRFCLEHGATRKRIQQDYRAVFRHCLAKLAQALYREGQCATRVVEHPSLGLCLELGRARRLLIPVEARAFVRLDVSAWPAAYAAGSRRLTTTGALLRELRAVLADARIAAHVAKLTSDFCNSFSSLLLNRFLGARAVADRRCLEPAYQGHHYYPFPGLRTRLSVEQIAASSHLSPRGVAVALLEVSALDFRSPVFASAEDCFAAWAGAPFAAADRVVPLHPWQADLSPVVKELLAANAARRLRKTIRCLPLASQRTVRVRATSYDIKLAVDAAITSEHRLIFRLNRANAPSVSALVSRLLKRGASAIEIQPDIASLALAEPTLGTHVAAIVRAPIRVASGETAIPAIDLWTGRERVLALLSGASDQEVMRFFAAYCRVVIGGPVLFLLRHGVGFEPHLQNSIAVFRGRTPVRLILRDLDGTILERRVAPVLATLGIELEADTWEHMPAADVADGRLVHSLFFGHLAEVVDFLARCRGADQEELLRVLAREWAEAPRRLALAEHTDRFAALSEHLGKAKSMLIARFEGSARMSFESLPDDRPFARESAPFWDELRREIRRRR